MRAFSYLVALVLVGCGKDPAVAEVPASCGDATSADVQSAADGTVAADDVSADSAPTDSGVTDSATGESAADGGECAIKTGGTACTSIPKLAAKQVVDGVGDEFCDIASTVVTIKDSPAYLTPNPPLPTKMDIRVAWSELGFHGHLKVHDAIIAVYPPNIPMDTDHVMVMVGGQRGFTGVFDNDKLDKAFVAEFVPEGPAGLHGFGNTPAVGFLEYAAFTSSSGSCGKSKHSMPKPAQWASRLVSGGYEIEFFFPWSTLGRTAPPVKGDEIAFNAALFTCDEIVAPGWPGQCRDALKIGRAVLAKNPRSGPCPVSGYGVDYDDTSWCRSLLD